MEEPLMQDFHDQPAEVHTAQMPTESSLHKANILHLISTNDRARNPQQETQPD